MSDVPKIVQDRLRAGVAVGAHPDADVLTAFAEKALSGTERENVIRHLSRCVDCREVVALSIPPVESIAERQGVRESGTAAGRATGGGLRAWFAWPNLRWAAMAAAVVVVASVLALYPGKRKQSIVEMANQQAEQAAPSQAYPSHNVSASAPAPLADRAEARAGSPLKSNKSLARENRMFASEARASRTGIQPSPVRSQPAADSVAQLADQERADSLERKSTDSVVAGTLSPQVPAAPVANATGEMALEHPQQKIGSASETVEVTAADAQAQAYTMDEKLTVTGRNVAAPPIEKAKPAAKEEVPLKAQAENGEAQKRLPGVVSGSTQLVVAQKTRSKQSKDVSAQWSLAQGRLQRSVDAGTTWQIALQLERPLLSFGTRGGDVWAGGQGGTLFHSTDSGTTWTMVQPSTKSESLKSDIVAIDVHGPAEIVLSTSGNESWSTADAGKTWDKK